MIALFFEFFFYFFFELVLEIAGQLLVELGINRIEETLQRNPAKNPFLTFISYALLGPIAGFVSYLAFPDLFSRNSTVHVVSLICTPVLAGLAMSIYGTWQERKGFAEVHLGRFANGFIFAFGLALVRHLLGGR